MDSTQQWDCFWYHRLVRFFFFILTMTHWFFLWLGSHPLAFIIHTAGSFFLVFSAPILTIAILAILYLVISDSEGLQEYVVSTLCTLQCHTLFFFLIMSYLPAKYWTTCSLLLAFHNSFSFSSRKRTSKYPRFRLWTFPVLVDGPFGVVSAAEFIGILLFIAFTIWAVCSYTLKNFSLLAEFHLPSKDQ